MEKAGMSWGPPSNLYKKSKRQAFCTVGKHIVQDEMILKDLDETGVNGQKIGICKKCQRKSGWMKGQLHYSPHGGIYMTNADGIKLESETSKKRRQDQS